MTLSRFSTFGYLPYKDLWTLYGPAQSLLGPILNLIIGRSLLGHRIINIIMLEAVVILTYLLCSKFIARSSAAVFATVIGLLTLPLSYLTALLFLLPGMYLAFFPHEGASTRNRSCQREIAGMVLIGCSLLGRLECGLLALWAVLVFICFSWKDNTRSRIAMVSLACLAPGLLFVIYLAFIPVETLVENFLRFPLHYYPLVRCRGLPVNWFATFRLFLALPFHGMWDFHQLTIVLGLLFLPIFGVALPTIALTAQAVNWRPLLLFLGGTDLLALKSMINREGTNPTPTLPLVFLSLSIICFFCDRWKISVGKRTARACAIFVGFTVIPPFIPGALRSWMIWPSYDPIVGFYDSKTPSLLSPDLYRKMAQDVDRLTGPREPIFVALENNAGHFANAATLYWALDRPPASRFFEFDPCLTDREDVQKKIVHDLARTKVIITHNFFQQPPFSNPPATALDNYLREHFREERTYPVGPNGEHYKLLVRKS